MNHAFVYDAVRTPFGKFGGGLAAVRPDDLAAHVIRESVKRAPGLDVDRIDEVVFGNANGAGEENRNVARMGTLLAGLPVSIPGTTVNRLCGSSLDAAIIASRQINTGDADLVLVGGVESMSRAPWVLPKTEKPYPAGDLTLASTTLGWRLVNKAMPAEWTISLGEATERLREKYGVTRGQQDQFAADSHNLAAAAWDEGFYDNLVTVVPGTDLPRDEGIRPGSTPEKLAALKTVFRKEPEGAEVGGTVTAGNASPLSDGASAAWVGKRERRRAARDGAAGPHRRAGRARQRSAVLRLRAGGSGEQGPGKGGHRVGPGGRRRTQRSLRRAVPGLHQCLGHRPVHREPARRRHRDGAPAGRVGYQDPGHPGPEPAGLR
ncbi:acetyl-CoA acetyltransferase family protein [Arthrobacter sp. B3I9]|nr:acetyl-CoA acetyltransferase family protein [Arthrobacter sp. B3I9]